MKVGEIKKVADTIGKNMDAAEKGLVGMGFDPKAVMSLFQRQHDMISGIMGSQPPPHLRKILGKCK